MLNLVENVNDDKIAEIFQVPTDKPVREAPHNLEAEQALLGAILVNNNALNHLDDRLTPEHFYAPIHQRIFKAILHLQAKGDVANHITCKHYFDGEQGGYLAEIMIASVVVINVREYAQMLIDLHLKRQLLELAESLMLDTCNAKIDSSGVQLLEATETKLFKLSDAGSPTKTLTPFKAFGNQALEMAERAHQHKGEVVGISTELKALDDLLGGLQNSDLIILGGRPSMGKTALATTIAYKAAQRFQLEAGDAKPQSVAFFSLEMSGEQLANRVQAAEAELNSSSILRGRLSTEQFDDLAAANRNLSNIPFLIDDTPSLNVAALRNRARRFKRTHNVALIVVDYLQLMTGSSRGGFSNRVNEISEITQALKAIAKELNVPVIALSQLSRAVESRDDKRPQLADLRESGSIEQDADIVMFVYREQYYLERTKPENGSPKLAAWQEEFDQVKGKVDIIVAKHRHGAVGNATLHFDGYKATFKDL